jgi:hypothetical protein
MVEQRSSARAKPKQRGGVSLSGKVAPGERSPIVGVRLLPANIAKVDSLAAREGVKRSEMVRRLLLAGIAAYRPRKG